MKPLAASAGRGAQFPPTFCSSNLRRTEGTEGITKAFEDAGTSRPVTLTIEQKAYASHPGEELPPMESVPAAKHRWRNAPRTELGTRLTECTVNHPGAGRARPGPRVGPMTLVWITVARGVMAIVLGLALALHGDRAPAALVKFMGLLDPQRDRHAQARHGGCRRTAPTAGDRSRCDRHRDRGDRTPRQRQHDLPPRDHGVVIALTGLAHLLGGFEIADASGRRWRPGVPLGVLELGLGATLVLTSERDGSLSTWLASAPGHSSAVSCSSRTRSRFDVGS